MQSRFLYLRGRTPRDDMQETCGRKPHPMTLLSTRIISSSEVGPPWKRPPFPGHPSLPLMDTLPTRNSTTDAQNTRYLQSLISDENLQTISVPKLNAWFKSSGLSKDDISALRRRRRTLKNRGYAANCRGKVNSSQRRLEETEQDLRNTIYLSNLKSMHFREGRKTLREQIISMQEAIRAKGARVPRKLIDATKRRNDVPLDPPDYILENAPDMSSPQPSNNLPDTSSPQSSNNLHDTSSPQSSNNLPDTSSPQSSRNLPDMSSSQSSKSS